MNIAIIGKGIVGGAAREVSDNQLDSPWIKWGMKEIGIKCTGIGADNPRIIEYWHMFGVGGIKNEKVFWCSAFVGAVLEVSGININSKDRSICQKGIKDSSHYWLHWLCNAKEI